MIGYTHETDRQSNPMEPSPTAQPTESQEACSQSSKTNKKRVTDDVRNALTSQVIVGLIVAIIMVLAHTFYPTAYQDIVTQIRQNTHKRDDVVQDANLLLALFRSDPTSSQDEQNVQQEEADERLIPEQQSMEIVPQAGDGALVELELAQPDAKSSQESDQDDASKANQAGGVPADPSVVPKNARIDAISYKSKLSVPLKEETYVTSKYGIRKHPITGEEDFHTGVDLAADEGTSIIAPAKGKVMEAGFGEKLGNYVKIRHNDGGISIYGHCKELYVKQGDQVKQGSVIAAVGSTGMSTGPHLHLAFILDGKYVNPGYIFKHVEV